MPIIPFHLWLPEAHVEAPTSASIFLAAILLKMASYSFLRFSIPLFPLAHHFFLPLFISFSFFSLFYSSLSALAQWDLKKFIAFSSIAHLNTANLALLSANSYGIIASFLFLLSHAFISSALFLAIAFLYDRYKSRLIKYYGGFFTIYPFFLFFFFLFLLANFAFPITSPFISEFLTFLAFFNHNFLLSFFATSAIILAPSYSLWFFHQIAFGNFSFFLSLIFIDLSFKEFHYFFSLFFLIFFLAIFPYFLFDSFTFNSLSILIKSL
jgi:NADH:ubiquinone oxidoreductase subunit 4 (subunit M)